jgi:VWFA-related protein
VGLILGAVAALGAGREARQQAPQAPPQPSVFRAGTDLVRVDVTVTSRDGEPVTDLQAADFDVTEDGVAQQVTAVQYVRLDGTRTSDLEEPLEIRSREHARREAERVDVRLFAIFLDDYHVSKSPDVTGRVREALAAFVKQLGPNDLLVLMDPLTTLHDLTYTRSKADALARIRTFEGRRGEPRPVRSAIEEEQLSRSNWMELRSEVTLSALQALVTHLGGLRESRTSVLFVSQGPLARPGSPNWKAFQAALQAAQRGSVTVHTFDPRPFGAVGRGDLLRDLSAGTGGRAIVNRSDPTEQLAGVIADASAYYVIGYAPTRRTSDGKFHAIEVRVKRRGARVAARRGYWAPSEQALAAAAETAARPVNLPLAAALAALADPTAGAAVSMWTGFSKAESGLTRVSMAWELSGSRGTGSPVRIEVQRIDDRGQDVGVALPVGAAPGPLPMVVDFDVPPGRHRFKVSSFDARGELLDRRMRTSVVPDFASAALVIASPRVLRATSPAEARTMEADPSPAPSAVMRFAQSDRVSVQVQVAGTAAADARVMVELLTAQGGVLRALETPALVAGSLRLPLPVGSLANGTYVLRIAATAAGDRAEQWLAFRVGR